MNTGLCDINIVLCVPSRGQGESGQELSGFFFGGGALVFAINLVIHYYIQYATITYELLH
jgi:hypothetical protein